MKYVFLLLLLCTADGLITLENIRASLTQVSVCRKNEGYPCDCTENFLIDCSHENLRTTLLKPVDDTSGTLLMVKQLVMSNNILTTLLPNKILPGHESTLETLDFSYNLITFIARSTFKNMPVLKTLDLSHNHLHDLENDTFEGLEVNLIELNLRNNYLRNLSGPALNGLTGLKYLDLSQNPISFLDQNTFRYLNALVDLNLEHAELSFISEGTFDYLTRLEYLSLSQNRFHAVPALSALKNLDVLSFHQNPVTTLNSHAFRGLNRLRELHATNLSDLLIIEDCAFCGLNNLRELVIANCPRLFVVASDAFGGVNEGIHAYSLLTLIDLESNNLTSLSSDLLPWFNTTTVKLGGNPWNCDCRITWMTDERFRTRYQGLLPKCAQPQRFSHVYIENLDPKDFCHRRFSAGRIVVAATISFLIAITIVLFVYFVFFRRRKLSLRSIFSRTNTPKYAYSNLAMSGIQDAGEDVIFEDEHLKKFGKPAPVLL